LPNTAPGADMVYPQLVKNLPQEWVEVLLEIINIAWKIGCFPKVWKAGLAVMIPKPGKDTSKIENHRFITLLPVLGKVYERLVKKRLNWEVEKRKILKDVQCGFRRNKSTIDNLVCFQRDAAYTLQNGLVMIAVFLDVDGAFDNLVHRQILLGLIEAGIRGRMLMFTKNYLEDREVHVRVGNTISSHFTKRKRGVPQGSALGPDYYNLGEHNIPLDDGDSSAGIFADDNNLWAVGRTIEDVVPVIKSVLEQLEIWASDIDLSFLAHKTKAMLITRKKSIEVPSLILNRMSIEFVDQIKFLGCIVEKRLNWDLHTKSIKAACIRRISIMKTLTAITRGSKADFLIKFYTTYIRSKLEYAAVVYHPANQSSLKKLNVIQNTALRIAFGARKTTPVSFMLAESGLDDLETRRNTVTLKYLAKVWGSDETNPVKSRIVKRGLHTTANKHRKQNQLNFLERSIQICAQFDLELKITEMLRVPDMDLPSPWECCKIKCSMVMEKKENLDFATSFKLLIEEAFRDFLDIYTDGSKVDDCSPVGAAFVIPKKKITAQYKLPKQTSIFQAEVIAIKKAVIYTKENLKEYPKVLICSDSKSALEALTNISRSGTRSREVASCYKELVTIPTGQEIVLQWVPAHVDIHGNDIADRAAKDGTTIEDPFTCCETPIQIMMIEEVIKKQQQYYFEENRNLSGNWFTIRKTRRKSELKIYRNLTRREGTIAFRLRSRHAGTHSYLARFYGDDNICDHCDSEETVEHILIDCDHYMHQRRHIESFFKEQKENISVNLLLGGFLSDELNTTVIRLVVQFLEKIGCDKRM